MTPIFLKFGWILHLLRSDLQIFCKSLFYLIVKGIIYLKIPSKTATHTQCVVKSSHFCYIEWIEINSNLKLPDNFSKVSLISLNLKKTTILDRFFYLFSPGIDLFGISHVKADLIPISNSWKLWSVPKW